MYDTVVDVATVRDHLDDPKWVIVDCRNALADRTLGRKMYEEGHIPGAFYADGETDLAGEKTGKNGRHPFPDRNDFIEFLRGLGVDDDTQIVAYDNGADMFAARLWLLCRWIGHKAVAVLDGGFTAWVNQSGGRLRSMPLQAASPIVIAAVGRDSPRERSESKPQGTITAREPLDEIVSVHDVTKHASNLLDARAAERYRGEMEPIDPVAGHIPGARNRPYGLNYDASGLWKSPQQLRDEFAAFGDPSAIVNYCGSGVSGAVNVLAIRRAGFGSAKLYPGGWSEWCSDPSRPVERTSA